MNKVFRIVWSEARQAWLVVSELTKIKGKSKAESQGQDIQSAVAFSSIFSSFPFHLLPHIVLLGLFSLALPAEAATVTLGGGVSQTGDENTVAIIGTAGPGSIAIGGGDSKKTTATGRTSVAIGYKADTDNYGNAVAVGNLAKGLGNSSVAIGDNAAVNGGAEGAVAIGKGAQAMVNNAKMETNGVTGGDTPAGAVAIGREAKAAYASVALGHKALANVSQSIAIGDKAHSLHNNAVAIGVWANATKNTSNAIGYKANATGDYATALGAETTASGKSAFAVNYQANASGGAAIAVGRLSKATGLAATALGSGSQALANRTIAIGENKNASDGHSDGGAKASAEDAISIGTSSAASGKSAVAMGREANATKDDAVALGHNATASGNNSTALGTGTTASNHSSIAIGSSTEQGKRTSANATAQNAIAIGGATASGFDSIAMGYNSTAGGNSTRQIAIGRDAKALEAQSVVLGSNSISNASGAIALGSDVIASGYSSIAIGGDDLDNTTYQEKGGSKYINTTSAGKGSVAIGAKSKANSDGSVVLGVVANATGNESMALGALSHANGTQTVALGASSNATAEYAIAIGSNASAASHSVAVGKNSVANQTGTTALGESSFATKERATALGNNSNATIANGSVAIGYQSVTTKDKGDQGWKQNSSNYSSLSGNVQTATHAAVAIGNNSTVTRQITGLAAGSADTDAVNVAQLKSLTLELKAGNDEGNVTLSNEKLEIKGAKGITTNVTNNVVTVTGSGLTVTPDSNGTYSSETSTLEIKTNDNWNADNNGGRYSGDNIETRKTANGILIGIKEEPTFKKVTINGNGPVLSSTGIDMNNKKITNLQAGEQDTDAVNKKQLDASIGSTTYKAQHGEASGYKIKHNENKTITIKPGDINNSGTFKAANLATSVDSTGNITIGFKEDPSFKDVTASNSIKINGGITINSTGIDMGAGGNRKITNLANGTDSNDAVNFSQLQEVKNSIQNLQGGNVKVQSTSPNQITATKEGDTIKVGAKVVDDIETGADGKASLPKNYDKHALVTANATMAAVNDASWLVKTTDKSGWGKGDWVYINPGDNVVYANGTGTTAEVSNKVDNGKDTLTVKINVNTGTTEVDNTGKAKPKTDQDNNKIATLADITKTINETSWTVTSDLASGGSREGDAKEEKVKAGDKVTLKAGDNLKITQDGKSFTYALTKNLNNISSISNGANNVGTKITLSPDSKNIDVGGANISNVGKPIHSNDAANKAYVDELAGKGITFQANTNKTRAIKLGDTVDIVGANTNQITTTADGNGKVSIGAKTIRVDIGEYGRAQLAQADLKNGGKGESLVTADTLVRAINEAGFLVKTTDQSGDPDTKKNRDWAWISPGYRVVYENGTGTTVSVSQTKDPKANVKKNTLLKVKVDVNTGNSTVNSDGKAEPTTADDKDKIATIGNITNTINNTFWKATSGVVDGGEQGGTVTQAQIKAGDMVTLQAGKNMKITQDGSTFTYALMDTLSNITSISNGGDSGTKITLSPDSKKIDVGNANITNVAAPTAETDATNKKYVDEQITANQQNFTVGADSQGTAQGISVTKDQNRFDIVGKDGVATNVSGRQIEVGLDPETKGKIETANTVVTTKGITFVSDGNGNNRTHPIKLGEELKVSGASNIKTSVSSDGKALNIGLENNVTLAQEGKITIGPERSIHTTLEFDGLTIKTGKPDTKISVTKDGIKAGDKKITDVAAGDLKENGTDAVNAGQLYTVQQEAKKRTSVKAADGQQVVKVEKSKDPNSTGGDEYVVDVDTSKVTLKYKANNKDPQTVSLTDGLDFTDTDNITATVEASGVVKHALKSALTGIQSIAGKTTNGKEATTITLSEDPNDKKVTLNTAKLTGLKEGAVSENSTDAVNGKQLHNFVKVNNKAAEQGGSVNFVNSTTTSVSADNGNVSVNVNNTTLPVSNGKVSALDEANKTKFVNAGDLATALGNLSFKVQATGANLIEGAKDTGAQNIKFGDTVQFEAGDNLLVGRTDKKFTYRLASNLSNITSISNGGDKGTKITLSPDEKKIDVGGARITNVGTPSQESDVVNKKYVDEISNDLGNKGITFVSDGDKRTKAIKLGEQLKIVGTNPKQITTTADGNGTISIGAKTVPLEVGNDGRAKLPSWTPTKENTNGENLVTAEKIITAMNNIGFKVKTTDGSGLKIEGEEDSKDWAWVSAGYRVIYENGNGTTVQVSQQKDQGADTKLDTLLKVKVDVNTGNSTVDNNGKAKPTTEEDKKKIATLEDITNTINGTFWKATSGTVDGGIQDGQTSVVNMKAGDMLTFKAGKNLKVKQDGNSFIYSLNDALSGISSISNGDDGVGTKITLSDQEKKVDVGGAKITNVAKPTEDGDAANKKYVDDLGNTLSNKGITFVSDGNTKNKTNPIKLGDELKVTGASNIKTSVSEDGSALNIGLTDDVQLSLEGEVTIGPKSGNRYTTLEYDGLTVKTGTPNAKDIAVTKDGIKAGDKKITDVADGNVTKDSKEAVNGSQLYTVQEEAKKRTSVKAADNQQIVNVTKSQQANETGGDEYVVSVDTSKVMLKYKANGKNDQNVSLTDGLNFTDTDNITATVDKNGVVKHALNSALVGVTSITAKKVADGEEEATKITLSEDPNDKKVTLNSAKITGLQDGTIADNSSDAINGKQLHNLVKVNGNAAEKNGSVNFVDSATTSVSAGNDGNVTITVNNTTLSVNGGKVTAPTNDADKAKFVNAGDLANVLGNLSFKVQATGNNLIDSAKDTSEKEIKFGDTVQFEAGENLLVGRTDKKFTYRLASNLTNIGSISNGENGKGTKITLSPTEKNVDVGGAKITNVGAPQDNSDAVNKKYVDDLNKALSNKGITFATDTGKTNPIKLGEQIKFTSGNPDQLTTEVDKNSAIKIGLKTIGSLGVGWDGKAYVDDAHKNSLVTATGVISAVNDASWLVKTTDQSGLDNKGNKDWVYINPGDNVVYENGVGTTVKVSNKVENGKDTVTVKYDVNTGTSTVGDNGKAKPTNGDADKDKIATLGDITNTINSTFWKVTSGTDGGSEAEGTKKSEQPIKAGDMVSLKAGKNLTIKQDGANFTFALSDTLKIDNLNVGEKGADGKPGEDGKISVNGKDGSSVVLNGKDGSIGLNGKDGKDGVTIKSADGAAGLDGKPGEHKTRIVYERKDPKDPNKTITEEVATLEDGQQYSADNYAEQDDNTVIKKKLNQRLEIKGGADGSKLTDNNIGVIVDSGVLRVKLAQQINLGNEGALITGRTKVNNDGITITPTTSADGSTKKPVSLSENGLDNGGNRITNVANGVADSDAVNKGQLTAAAKGAKTEVQSEDSSIEVTETQGKDKQTIYDLSVVKSGLTVSDDKRTLTADKAGNAFVTGETVANAVNTATAAARTEVTSDNGSITLDPTVGKNGQEIYDLAVAKSNLTISPDGKTVSADKQGEAFVTGANVADMLNKAVASARTAVEGGTNVQVSAQNAPDGHDIYTVSVEGDLTNISSISNDGTQISLGKDDKGNKAVNVNGAKIGGVADGVADSDAVNMGQLTAAAKGAKTEVQSEDSSIEVTETQGKDKQTIYDLSVVKSGLTVSDDKRTLTADKAGNAFVTGETVASAVNTATAAARTEVVEGKNIQVVEQTGEHGQNVYNLSISGLPMEYVTTDNKPVVNMGGKFYLEEVKDSGEVKLTPVVNNNGKFLTQTINPDGTISLNPIQVKVNLANKTPMQLGNIADGTADNDAVNVRQLKATKTEVESTDNSVVISERQGENKQTVYNLSVAKTGLTLSDDKRTVSADFAGNHFATGEEVAKAINATAAAARTEVIGGTNVKVKTEIGEKGQNRYTLSVSGDLTDIHSISNGDTKLSLSKDNEGNPVVNVNGARVSNVADARADGDAINAKQLKNVVNAIGAGMDRLSRDIQNVDSNARAGIAAAGAMANLPQVYLPGKSAVAIAGAYYRGQSAYALGYSRTSDNGKWIIRASAANNTQQDVMVGAGASYIW
ncbi:autotransporter adhesin [[Pasteurella] mairii]|uniref:Autotransporter adhesin n=1 Tax=[Pasteurella] mairii TaxID=757 RepID=A0A379B7N9_9PAST|nr:autotransporter adhesin [[Pasteurella] mairii]